MSTWLQDAQAAGVLVLDRASYTSDGDAYTLAGAARPPATGRPVLDSLDPDTFAVGDPDAVLRCLGSGFSRDSFIAFAGRAERTDFVSDTELSTGVDSASWQAADTVQVAVVAPGRGSSASLPFEITESLALPPPASRVPEGTVADVLAWVGDDLDRAREALDRERAEGNRRTLIERLEELLA